MAMAYSCRVKSHCTASMLLLAFAIFVAACGEPGARFDAPASLGASPSAISSHELSSPSPSPPETSWYGDEFNVPVPESHPAEPDEYGAWTRLIMQGIETEIPTGQRWRVQILSDPCHGDARYRYVLEDTTTGDRIKVDVVEHRVAVASADPSRLEGVVARIRRSFRGEQTPYPFFERHGPNPTEPSCASEGGGVPTLVPDSMTPQPPTRGPSTGAP